MSLPLLSLEHNPKTDAQFILIQSITDIQTGLLTDVELQFLDRQIKAEQSYSLINHYNQLLVFIVIKKESSLEQTLEQVRKTGNLLVQIPKTYQLKHITIKDTASQPMIYPFLEGFLLGSYKFSGYHKQEPKPSILEAISIDAPHFTAQDLETLSVVLEGTLLARNWVNRPYSELNTAGFADALEQATIGYGIKTEVLSKSRIQALKMGGLLGVNQGSYTDPAFVIMEYKPEQVKNTKPVVLVGKGIVFDTGGISLKPTSSMDGMKGDMGGGAVVGAVLHLIARLKLPIHVVGLVPISDNRINGHEVVIGDVMTMMDGTTVENVNTDAEGRLILADALHYAKSYDPELVIDLATLTGAALMAVGHVAALGFSNDASSMELLKQSGLMVNEKVAELPLWNEYAEGLKSDVADLKNVTGSRLAGATVAAKFLEHFTDYPWIHLDIAGPALLTTKDSYRTVGGTGYGVRLLHHFLTQKYIK